MQRLSEGKALRTTCDSPVDGTSFTAVRKDQGKADAGERKPSSFQVLNQKYVSAIHTAHQASLWSMERSGPESGALNKDGRIVT